MLLSSWYFIRLKGGGCMISLRGPYIPSDMRPGTGAHITRDMRPGGPISLGIWDQGAPKVWGAYITTTPGSTGLDVY